jgi:hypothetical protein
MNPVFKYLAVCASIMVIMLGCATVGWTLRGWRCDTEMANYKADQSEKAGDQREASQAIEIKQEATTGQSTQRLDTQQAEQQKETVYVEKQVIQYRDRWRDRSCRLSDDWLQLYNESLFGSDQAMPEAVETRSAPAGADMLLPSGRN